MAEIIVKDWGGGFGNLEILQSDGFASVFKF